MLRIFLIISILSLATLSFAADGVLYKDAYVVTKVIQTDDGFTLDLPFQIYSQTIVEGNRNHYCYVRESLKDVEVLALIHYKIEDEKRVKGFNGYLGENWKDVKDVISKYWTTTKEDAWSTTNDRDEVVLYSGIDKNELVKIYGE